jgi:hypothetical protein
MQIKILLEVLMYLALVGGSSHAQPLSTRPRRWTLDLRLAGIRIIRSAAWALRFE